ncbi:MAG TPA: hypothetical protein VME70_09875 [Mycobacteriales bacterium]|nr:hypothetical protein [Mycobacteriales bacterium]
MNELPPEVAEQAQRRLRAARALDMRNNRYGAASSYIAWALEILLGFDALDTAVSLADGATVEALVAGHLPVAQDDLERLRGEVRSTIAGVEAASDPAPRAIEAATQIRSAMELIEKAVGAG